MHQPHIFMPFLLIILFVNAANAQSSIDNLLPVRSVCIGAPKPQNLDRFIKFINEELPLNKINTLVLRVDYRYQFETHPELSDSFSLSKQDVKQLVNACKRNNIHLIPLINLLGHQSWAGVTHKLLKVYPQFDETPQVIMPIVYAWPNADSLYCKSYCPLHPDLHKIVFDLVDEICDVFETNTFHAGMDEVFYIGDPKCPRCGGKDKAVLFASEVNIIRNHLALQKRKLWIWGDRLIDGTINGIGMWEGSFNNTQSAINLIKKDIVICDWHYDKAEQTPVYFAKNGFNVITATWRNPAVAMVQTQDMVKFRKLSKLRTKKLYNGIMQTVWSNPEAFFDEYYTSKLTSDTTEKTQANCFKAMTAEITKLNQEK